MKRIAMIVVSLVLLSGCGQRRQEADTVLVDRDHAYMLTIVLDMSGSFQSLMCEGGKAYEFAMQVVDRYFRDRLGTQDEIVIAMIAGSDRALIWQGTPRALRSDFASAHDFGVFLRSKVMGAGSANGSCVFDSISNTLEYVMSDSRVASGKAKSAVFVLSDMLDNASSGQGQEAEQRTLDTLGRYAQMGGTLGVYYVDQSLVATWREYAKALQFKHCVVEGGFVGRPTLPNFE